MRFSIPLMTLNTTTNQKVYNGKAYQREAIIACGMTINQYISRFTMNVIFMDGL